MSVSEPRPSRTTTVRPGSIVVWGIIVVLGLAFAGLTVYRILARDRSEEDADRLRELTHASPRPAPRDVTKSSADWPQWRGPNRDGASTETGLRTDWPESGPKALWSQSTGAGYSSVVVSGGYAFTMLQDGEHEAVVCWEAETGRERWQFKYPAHFRQPYGDGPRSTPAIAGEHIYTVGGSGIMHCLRAYTHNPAGEAVWRKDLLEEFGGRQLEWGISFSPLVENGRVYVMPGGRGDNSLAALDAGTGAVVWKNLDDAPSYSSPVMADLAGERQVVFLTSDRLVGLKPDTGKLLWEFPWPAGPVHAPSSIATPLIVHLDVGDYVFVSSGYGKGCALIKVATTSSGPRPEQVYKNQNLGTVFSSCVRQGDFLYGFSDVNLACVELRTGKRRWKEAGFGKGSVTLADGHLILLGDEGTLALAVADPSKYREVARFQHSDQPSSWTVPVFVGGRLFVRDKKRLVCYDVKKLP